MIKNTVPVLYRGNKEPPPPPAFLYPKPNKFVRGGRGGGRKKSFHFTINLNSDILPYNFTSWLFEKLPSLYIILLRLVLLLFCCYRKSYWTLPHTTKTIRQAIQYYIHISHYSVLNCNGLPAGEILLHATRDMKISIQCYTKKCHYTVLNYIIYWQFQVQSNSSTLS